MTGEPGPGKNKSLEESIEKASLLFDQNRVDEGLKELKEIIVLAQEKEKAYTACIGLLQEHELWQESIRLTESALNVNGGNHEFWFLKGNALDALYPDIPSSKGTEAWKKLEEALECYKRAIEINKAFPLTWFHRALVEEKLGRHREAMESYQRFLDLNPGPELSAHRQHARDRIAGDDIAALPPASVTPEGPQSWLGRLADGGPGDAEAFVNMAKSLKTTGRQSPPPAPVPATQPSSPSAPPAQKTTGGAESSAEAELYLSALSEKKPKTLLWSIPLEVILLFLALPVLVPSLLINFLMAKRWGRIDYILIAVDGFVILLFALRSTFATVIVLTAMAASGLLLILRWQKMPYGIFLGYSNMVAMLLMGGGLLFIIGFWQFIPWTPLNELTSAMGGEKAVRADDLVKRRMDYNSFVVLQNATAEFEQRVYRIIENSGYRFSPYRPGAGITITNPGELWERRNDLAGKMVTLQGASLSPTAVESSELEYAMSDKGTKEKDYGKRLLAVIPEAGGRVWAVSKPGELKESEFLSQQSLSGMLVITYANRDMGRWYASRYRGNLPYMGVALLPERTVAETSEKPMKLETWVPVRGTEKTLWLVFPGDVTWALPTSLKGIYKGNLGPTKGLREVLTDVSHFQGPLGQPLVILAAPSRAAYIKNYDLVGEFLRGIRWGSLSLMIPGMLVILGGLYLSSRE